MYDPHSLLSNVPDFVSSGLEINQVHTHTAPDSQWLALRCTSKRELVTAVFERIRLLASGRAP